MFIVFQQPYSFPTNKNGRAWVLYHGLRLIHLLKRQK